MSEHESDNESDNESEDLINVRECDDVSDVLNWLRLTVAEFLTAGEETRYYLFIPSRLIGNLIAFKKSLADLLDIYERYLLDEDDDPTGLEPCRFREKYVNDEKFNLMLFFSYADEDNEMMEIQAVAFWDDDDSDDDSDRHSDHDTDDQNENADEMDED